ncbi:hypothetical protein PAXRUDRAFT_138447 [Paxillus rubicundulus Ve08.2h10]|uniref:Uncharacterized protein n=1 Tax=Paxillus rubicundulus Ve08.2h10 TaxID=930991 RepID=A0A0D0DSK2_9AGAM|nr:hypothetical protein PAXRUDRAFT_138447 [Paxillus rubicundulus Ve08.2h10]
MKVARGSKARSCNHCHQLKHKCKQPGDLQPMQQRKQEEVILLCTGKKKEWTQKMWNMATDRRHMAVKSHTQMEWLLNTLEEICGCIDPEFVPEELEMGLEEEVAEAAEERETLKGQSKEVVDESIEIVFFFFFCTMQSSLLPSMLTKWKDFLIVTSEFVE